MSGIYASLRQAQIIILEILNVWMPVPLYLSGVVIIFAFLDLGKNISFSDSLLRRLIGYVSSKRSRRAGFR
jgi:hypothetical protein